MRRLLAIFLLVACLATSAASAKDSKKSQPTFKPNCPSRRASLGNFKDGCWVQKAELVLTAGDHPYLNPKAKIYKANASGRTEASRREIKTMEKNGYGYLQGDDETDKGEFYMDTHDRFGRSVKKKPKGWIPVGWME